MSGITTHVLDTASGRPASGVPVTLERERNDGWQVVGGGTTDADGRLRTLFTEPPEEGTYRITFNTGAYFPTGFFPSVTITFRVSEGQEHYHVPLLLSPYGYSTYRGS
jgi:5-hydroxyisourate hydrolase